MILSRVEATRYVVAVCSCFAVDFRAGRRRVGLAGSGGLGSVATTLYGVDVLSIA